VNTLDYKPAGAEETALGRQEGLLEIELLLSAGQLQSLDEAARQRRMTAAALVRRLIHDFLSSVGQRP